MILLTRNLKNLKHFGNDLADSSLHAQKEEGWFIFRL
jgi:hypothetical protein